MSQRIVYRFELSLALPLAEDPDDPDYYTLEQARDHKHLRWMEKTVLHCLKKMDGDCDVECLDSTVEDE